MRALSVIAVALLAAGCGGSDPPVLKVAAPRSLEGALTTYARRSGTHLRYVRPTERPDVIVGMAGGLAFAANKLVLVALPGRLQSIDALGDPGVRIAVAPYARRLVERLPAAAHRSLRVSSHPVEDVLDGQADGAIAYYTEAHGADRRLVTIDFKDALHPRVVFEAAAVRGAPAQAEAFVRGLRRQIGRAALVQAGFTPR